MELYGTWQEYTKKPKYIGKISNKGLTLIPLPCPCPPPANSPLLHSKMSQGTRAKTKKLRKSKMKNGF